MSTRLNRLARKSMVLVTAAALTGAISLATPAAGVGGAVSANFTAQDALSSPGTDWLHTDGNQIVNSAGESVWLTGTNWFGFNATERVFHGLWSVNITSTTKAMADRGINVVRVPVSTQLLLEWRAGQTITPNVNSWANPELNGMNNLQVFDYWLNLCEQFGLKVIIDVHSAEADNSGHVYNMWYKGSITTADALNAWEWVADRYKNNDTIIGADIKNEPHGGAGDPVRAKWDSSTDADNFKHYAEQASARILAKNPNLLVLVEGIQIYPKNGSNWSSTSGTDYDNYWWGGNLKGVAQHPVNLGQHQDQLVYSPHDYGPLVSDQPWFTGTWNRQTLETNVWDPNWLYIHKQDIAPLLVGEWGGFLDNGPNQKWMTAIRDLIAEQRLHHTFWVLNPNSGDTGGLLKDDWTTWDEAKYALLKPTLWQHNGKFVSLDHEVKLGGSNSTTGISLADAVGSAPSPTPTPTTTSPKPTPTTTSPEPTPTTTTPAPTPTSSTPAPVPTFSPTPAPSPAPVVPETTGFEPLRDAAERSGRFIGFAYAPWHSSDATYQNISKREFNMLTAENSMKWDAVQPSQGSFQFSEADQVAQFASDNDQELYGHTLVWHSQLPSWVSNISSASSLRSVMNTHIATVAGRYREQAHSWDVVNEAFNEDGTRRPSVFQNVLGNSYIEEAFVAARAADSDAQLCINDYNTDGINAKSDALYALVKDFKQRGVPIDCVGFQAHLIVGQVPSTVQANLERFAALGVEVRFTELDIRMTLPADASKLATQANDYQKIFQACWNVEGCNGVTLWGVTDKYSWIPDVFSGQGDALLWNSDYSLKPALAKIGQVIGLQALATPTPTPTSTSPDPSPTSSSPTATPTSPTPSGVCSAVYSTTGNWGSGFQGQIVVTASAPVSSWTVKFSLGGATTNNLWGGVLSGSAAQYTVTNQAWNGSLGTGQTSTLGFVANGSAPSSVSVSCN